MIHVLGLDLSLTATGIADMNETTVVSTKFKGVERLAYFANWMRNMTFRQYDIVVIEGYAFGAAFKREALGELGGVVRVALFENRVPFVEIPPTTVKKYATGKGNANKDEMLSASIKRSGLDINNNNAADAWWLYQMGLAHYDPVRAVEMPAVNRTALDKVEWPDLKEK